MENIHMDLRLFDANTQVTTQQSLTEEMKTFYSDYLIDAAEPELVHDQFAQKCIDMGVVRTTTLVSA